MLKTLVCCLVLLLFGVLVENKRHRGACPLERKNNIEWPRTKIGKTAVMKCPNGSIGNATRYCGKKANRPRRRHKRGVWEEPSLANCTPSKFQQIIIQVKQMKECMNNFSARCKNSTSEFLLEKLNRETSNLTRVSSALSTKVLDNSVSALDVIIKFNKHINNTKDFLQNDKNRKNLLNTASKLLDRKNSHSWMKLKKKGSLVTLLKILDDVGFLMADTFNNSANNSIEFETQNFAMKTSKVDPKPELPVHFEYEESAVSLPVELFSSTETSVAVNIIFLTLDDILELQTPNSTTPHNESSSKRVSTNIVSSTVTPRRTNGIQSFVRIVLKNKRTLNQSQPVCVSWNPGSLQRAWSYNGCHVVSAESDDEKTTCACNHLTLFSAFMDPYQIPISNKHRLILDLISLVGCSVSLLAILTTSIVILSHWKKLKSPRTEVLLNMCAAIGIVCVLVLVEQPARHSEVLCKVVAILLHYFLLTLFTWMFCEGLLLYIVLVQVNMTDITDKSKRPLYWFGWGFPLLLLLISLWATELRGYGDPPIVCWLSPVNGVVWAFIAPALVVLTVNAFVLYKIISRLNKSQQLRNISQIGQIRAGTRAAAAITPLLGVTWIFGMLTFSSSLTVFKYVFAVLNSLQGVFIFIFHCLLDRKVRRILKLRPKRRTRPLPLTQVRPCDVKIIYQIKPGIQAAKGLPERRKPCVISL